MRYRIALPLLTLLTLSAIACERKKPPPPIPIHGSITVSSTPDSASIQLNGKATGAVTPDTLRGLAAGRYVLALEKQGYLPWSFVVEVYAGRDTSMTVVLVRAPLPTGSIAISSLPTGAAVALDGIALGRVTDGTFTKVAVGRHKIRLTMTGYEIWTDSVLVMPNQLSMVRAPLVRLPSTLVVTSIPPGAAIDLDHTKTGQVSPASFPGLRTTAVSVRLFHSGHFPYEGFVTLIAGDTVEVAATLDPAPNLTLAYALGESLLAIGLDGLNQRVLATETGRINVVRWSPDGQRLCYLSHNTLITILHRNIPFSARFLYDSVSPQVMQMLFRDLGINFLHPASSFGDRPFAYVRQEGRSPSQLWLMNADEHLELAWISPQMLIFTLGNQGVYRFDRAAATVEQVIARNGITHLRVSPNGTRYAFVQNGRLFLGRVGNWSPTRVEALESRNITDLAWSPGNDAVVCATYSGDLWWCTESDDVYRIIDAMSPIASVSVTQ